MTDHVLEVSGLSKSFGGITVTRDLSLAIRQGELHGIIGPNGAGKTSLIAQLFGEILPDEGKVQLLGRDVTRMPTYARSRLGMRRSFQITTLVLDFTVLQNVMIAVIAQREHGLQILRSVASDRVALEECNKVLVDAGLAARAEAFAGDLSHGEQRRLELALALQGDPHLVLLDEPVAGLGHDESKEMTERLRNLKGRTTAVLVEHDLDAVFGLADRISVLVRGQIVATGSPQQIRSNALVREVYLGEDATC